MITNKEMLNAMKVIKQNCNELNCKCKYCVIKEECDIYINASSACPCDWDLKDLEDFVTEESEMYFSITKAIEFAYNGIPMHQENSELYIGFSNKRLCYFSKSDNEETGVLVVTLNLFYENNWMVYDLKSRRAE